ncbi:MAG: hypothetical protein WBW06_02360, partial [Xanthobacteraceae bacterium]
VAAESFEAEVEARRPFAARRHPREGSRRYANGRRGLPLAQGFQVGKVFCRHAHTAFLFLFGGLGSPCAAAKASAAGGYMAAGEAK